MSLSEWQQEPDNGIQVVTHLGEEVGGREWTCPQGT